MKYEVKRQSYLILSVIFSTSLFPGRPSYSMTVEVFIIINNSVCNLNFRSALNSEYKYPITVSIFRQNSFF